MASVILPTPSETAAAPSVQAPAPQKRNYARIAEQTWIWTIVGYTILRFVVAWGAFSAHGANVWIFGLLDVGTSWPYAKAIAAVCKRAANSEWRRLPVPIAIALGTFFAPYAYLWFAAGEMPPGVRIGMTIFVSVLLVAASAGVLAKTRKLRAEAAAAKAADTDAADALIDVRDPGAVVVASFADVSADEAGEVIDLRDPASVSDLVIDLTSDEVTIERSTAAR